MPSNDSGNDSISLSNFIEEVTGSDPIRIEEDFGHGFVRLRSSEAERRQAAQDIRSSEDVVIELLRNSRDAGAKNIYVATGRIGDIRTLIVIDDGLGIPASMEEKIFQPRVTSKLDTAHMDKWGLHGRGMALFSIAENSLEHCVVYSSEGHGTSIKITLSMTDISEKKDQSTFPYFEIVEGVFQMRGPKNIQRVICEFAIDNRNDVNVYYGSFTEICATLYSKGIQLVPAKERIFSSSRIYHGAAEMLSYANDPDAFRDIASLLGLQISSRSARRILDGEIKPLETVFSLVESSMAFGREEEPSPEDGIAMPSITEQKTHFNPRITKPDLREFEGKVISAFDDLSEKYYLENQVPKISVKRGKLIIEFDLLENSQGTH